MSSFEPPAGGLDIPHPRMPADIIVRTIALQTFSAVAYGHLIYLLGFRKPHGVGPLPRLLILVFVLLPELLILQLSFFVIAILIAKPYRRRVAGRFKRLPYELKIVPGKHQSSAAAVSRLGLHAGFAVFNAIPLAAVVGAYRQRLKMTYHQLTYAANLGLDHRNGWSAFGGLAAVAVTECVVVGLLAVVIGDVAITGEDRPSSTADGLLSGRNESNLPPHFHTNGILGKISVLDWSLVLEVAYASGIHQIILAATNHPIPILVIFKAWYLWPVAGIGVWWLLAKKGASVEVVGLVAALLLVLLTVGSQLIFDALELWLVSSGQVAAYNFRWQVKDRASFRHTPDP